MSVLDRVQRTPERSDQTSPTESSSVPAVAEPAVIRRLRIVIDQLTDFASASATDDRMKRYGWILKGIVEELLDEMAASAEEGSGIEKKLPYFFEGFGRVMEWCGSGDTSVLPPDVLSYLIQRHPKEIKAIEGPGVLERIA